MRLLGYTLTGLFLLKNLLHLLNFPFAGTDKNDRLAFLQWCHMADRGYGRVVGVNCNGAAYLLTESYMGNPDGWLLRTEGGIFMKRLLLIAMAMALLLALASTLPAAAHDYGQARATMSCTDNTSTMTRTVVVTVTWKGIGVDRMDAQAWGVNPTALLGSGSITFPLADKGTESMTFAFSDTAQFDNVQWQLYSGAAIAAELAGILYASNFPGC
jgi:hypothetical protein